ncbi:two-component system, sensor histidine kinase YesM [Paenibacillus algorifonticola]|uniref:histidine kinase n=1 Tax=Paenibacillus algorifonticola TaxID=684063 RepID=A0A1I1Y672_9BACL|nr:sensor histidine kinase [Paenibacillus algorifonticola]SFE15056.1 two-component system, sensor histidine kinase YesM [Paenibacillus algorifonticola]
MKRLSKIYRAVLHPFRRSIRNKLILIMVLVSVLPIVAVTALAVDNNRKSMEAELIETNVSNMKWTSIYLGEQFSQMNSLLYSVLINPSLNEYIASEEESGSSSQFAAQRNIEDALASLLYSGNYYLSGIDLYLNRSGKLFKMNASQTQIKTLDRTPAPYEELFSQHKDFMIRNSPEGDRFQLIRSINRFENREILGGITLEVRWAILDQTLSLLNPAKDQTVLIAGPDGEILYRMGSEAIPPEELAAIVKGGAAPGYERRQNDYVFYNTIDPMQMRLIKIIPLSAINKSAQATMHYGILVGTITVAAAILIAVLLAWRTARPIVMLARSMQGLSLIRQGDKPLSGRMDEIGLLETKLYNMSHRIREHIKSEYSMNLEKKTAELKALQAQINPHFLQNTLQMIGSMLFSKKPAESYETIRSLSEMFRYVIREPDALASLRQELEHMNNYMVIQQQRFQSRLQYSLEVDERLLQSRIPKLTLQPVVENAFMHGLDSQAGGWKLSVKVAPSIIAGAEDGVGAGAGVTITISDNGVGISAERLREVRQRLSYADGEVWTHGERIGLGNVASRLQMHFGKAYGLTIDSEAGVGTRIAIHIPGDMQGGELHD